MCWHEESRLMDTEMKIPEDLKNLYSSAKQWEPQGVFNLELRPSRVIELIERIATLTAAKHAAEQSLFALAEAWRTCVGDGTAKITPGGITSLVKDYQEDRSDLLRRAKAAEERIEALELALTLEKDKPAKSLPRLVSCAVIIQDGAVLLEKRAPAGVQGLDGMWDLPGGKVECGESPAQAIVREIREELGVEVTVERMLPDLATSTWKYPDGEQRHWILAAFVCHIFSGTVEETDTLRWIPLGEIRNIAILEADWCLITAALAPQAPAQTSAEKGRR